MKPAKEEIQLLWNLYEERKPTIQARLFDFARVSPSDYFYELAYCLMTPQSSAIHADAVVSILRSRRFLETGFNPEGVLREKEHYIRFHRNKARYLLEIRRTLDAIQAVLSNGHTSDGLREWLVNNVKGLGYKEATHFLRNIGRNNGLAILDRHILRNLRRYGAIRHIPPSLSRKQYLSIEKRFREFSVSVGIPLDELDLLFWSMETGEIRK
jgi:N-glycosylase/DNA lyase